MERVVEEGLTLSRVPARPIRGVGLNAWLGRVKSEKTPGNGSSNLLPRRFFMRGPFVESAAATQLCFERR